MKLLTFLTLLTLLSCSKNNSEVTQTRIVNLQTQFIEVIETNCYSCHDGDSEGYGGFNFAQNIEIMTTEGIIVSGDSASSPLFIRMTASDSTVMPPSGAVDADSLAIVQEYIDTLDGE